MTYEGDNTVLLQAVSKALLAEFMSIFSGEKRITELMGHMKGQIGIVFRNKNFFTKHQTSHLRNLEMFLDAFVYREFKLIRLLANKLKQKTKIEGKSGFDAWNECLDLVLTLGKAYVDRVVIEKYVEAIHTASDANVRGVLELLCNLFALSKIESEIGWFLTYGFFAPSKAKAISEEINKLCYDIRPHALQLVDCFGIPEHLINSPLANNGWLEENKKSHLQIPNNKL